MDINKGKFLTFEGCEGVGKSKQISLLSDYLNKTNQEFILFREPGGTQISEKIREIILNKENMSMSPLCELLLYISARAQLVAEKIKKELENNKLVICDRFIDSSVAYQGYGRGLDVETINTLNKVALNGINPDYTIFLDLDPKTAFDRKGGADVTDRLEMEHISFHEKVYQGYKAIEKDNAERFLNIKPIGTVEDTHKKIINLLQSKGIIK